MKKFKNKKHWQGKIIHLSGTKFVWEGPYLLLMSRNGNTKTETPKDGRRRVNTLSIDVCVCGWTDGRTREENNFIVPDS
jgi:hypothetical protein